MSLITHRCTKCGHPDYWRSSTSGGCPGSCYCRTCTPGAPELVPTFDLAARPVEKITPPGVKTGFGVATHDCAACRALYDELTGAAA